MSQSSTKRKSPDTTNPNEDTGVGFKLVKTGPVSVSSQFSSESRAFQISNSSSASAGLLSLKDYSDNDKVMLRNESKKDDERMIAKANEAMQKCTETLAKGEKDIDALIETALNQRLDLCRLRSDVCFMNDAVVHDKLARCREKFSKSLLDVKADPLHGHMFRSSNT